MADRQTRCRLHDLADISEAHGNQSAGWGRHPGRHFGIALVLVGIGMLVLGIVYHVQFMLALRHSRKQLTNDGLIRGESPFPLSLTLVTAVFLLGISIAAITSMIFHIGPFE